MTDRPDLTDDVGQLKRYITSLEVQSDRAQEKNKRLEQRVERLERAIDEALRYKKRHKGYIFVNRNAWKIVYEALASQEEA